MIVSVTQIIILTSDILMSKEIKSIPVTDGYMQQLANPDDLELAELKSLTDKPAYVGSFVTFCVKGICGSKFLKGIIIISDLIKFDLARSSQI